MWCEIISSHSNLRELFLYCRTYSDKLLLKANSVTRENLILDVHNIFQWKCRHLSFSSKCHSFLFGVEITTKTNSVTQKTWLSMCRTYFMKMFLSFCQMAPQFIIYWYQKWISVTWKPSECIVFNNCFYTSERIPANKCLSKRTCNKKTHDFTWAVLWRGRYLRVRIEGISMDG